MSDKTTISIPENGDQFIKVQRKGEDSILTKLPDEFSGVDGKRCSDGSVIYTCGKSLALEVRKINETEREVIMIAYSGGGNSLCSVSFSASYVGIGFAVSFDVPNGRNGGSGASLNRLENGNYTKKGHTYKAYVRKTYKVTPHAEYRKLKRGTVYTRTWATHELISNYPYLKKTA